MLVFAHHPDICHMQFTPACLSNSEYRHTNAQPQACVFRYAARGLHCVATYFCYPVTGHTALHIMTHHFTYQDMFIQACVLRHAVYDLQLVLLRAPVTGNVT